MSDEEQEIAALDALDANSVDGMVLETVPDEDGEFEFFVGDEDELLYATANKAVWGNPDANNHLANYTLVTTFMGKSLRWHKWALVPLKKVEADIVASGVKYNFNIMYTYSNRNIVGSKTKSMHAWPLAIDINPAQNPYRQNGPLITNLPSEVISAFKRHGFRWGGNWKRPVDPMHFEYVGPPIKDAVIPGENLKKGSRGDDVKDLQQKLKNLGWTLEVDGIFGDRTDAIVRSFQGSKGIDVDGIVGPQTRAAFSVADRVLKRGMKGRDAVWVQRILNRVLKANLEIDGIFGKNTESAVKTFQQNNKLEVDGIVGKNTWLMLRRLSN